MIEVILFKIIVGAISLFSGIYGIYQGIVFCKKSGIQYDSIALMLMSLFALILSYIIFTSPIEFYNL